jgi:formate dehydrogenase (coenzyme F420) alpha subunit
VAGEDRKVMEERVENFRTVCGICSGTCGMVLTVRDGTVCTAEGDDDHPVSKGHLCLKGRAFPELLHAPDRLKHPLLKTQRGEWEEVSWDRAYDLLAERLRAIKQDHGPEALAVHVGQAGVGKEFSLSSASMLTG